MYTFLLKKGKSNILDRSFSESTEGPEVLRVIPSPTTFYSDLVLLLSFVRQHADVL